MIDFWEGIIDHDISKRAFYEKGTVTKLRYDILVHNEHIADLDEMIQNIRILSSVYPEMRNILDRVIQLNSENKTFDKDGLSFEEFKIELDRYNLYPGAIRIISSYLGNKDLQNDDASWETVYKEYLKNGPTSISNLLTRYSKEDSLELMSLCIFGKPQSRNIKQPEVEISLDDMPEIPEELR